MPIIEVNHVTKEYQLGQLQSLKSTALNQWRRLTGQPVEERAPFKALDDVSFNIEAGEVVGIIGHNGAGKSTMLKLLANISKSSSGNITVKGKIAPLIEVGAGLVGDLTGRENIYLNGAILGIPKAEIKRKFDDIVAFAELEEFIDTPIKRYSSGMSVRLGFAIATSIDADILIVDEVLAVGDLAFQRKCFDRMEDLIHQQGRTVLLVSHNIRQVERLCTRALLLDHGRISAEGAPKDICELFYKQSNAKISEQVAQQYKSGRNVRMTGEVTLESLTLFDAEGSERDELVCGAPATIHGIFNANREIINAEIVYGFHTTDMVYIASMGTAHLEDRATVMVGRNFIECKIERLPLVPGTYGIRVGVLDRNRREIFYGENMKIFTVHPKDVAVSKMAMLGLVDIPARWEFSQESTFTA
ncbi:ABC transporter ATP-binding protein [Candidatus Nitrotoga sp. 1052]|uniref:ABC transporter ATP-binding protein n=1 Tax=Candidatus Nitrotoga sp. 1052 TaxID=2886964 RepID=UPI001EF5CD64|nr:ABC transporter ATP-binding protein [Candidatus Nitrotoga sp. 1052]CAH1087249.1 Polysaccharide/polyol phosphate ABC transporter [Candidatus Nitrotoga sp. 1052]